MKLYSAHNEAPQKLFDLFRLNRSSQTALTNRISKSAFNPILILTILISPSFLFAAYLFKDDPLTSRWLLIAAALPMVVACLCYVGFAVFKPEKLQSESYQLRHEAIQLVAMKGKGFAVPTVSLEAITNPTALGSGEDSE